MLKISFKKLGGSSLAGVMFCWELAIESDSPGPVCDRFIPELFYDFFYVQNGRVACLDKPGDIELPLGRQFLKTIHTRPQTLALYPPLVLFGARLWLQFAESYWEPDLPSNRYLEQRWVESGVSGLDSFADQVYQYISTHATQKTAGPMLTSTFDESQWLNHYSPRHKRRLYKSVFGVSRKEIDSIRGLHAFLGRACDFSSQSPRIIEYIDAEVFYDQPHFNHLFRKMTDLSPLEYLQANSILQDNLLAASYNELPGRQDTMGP